MANLDGTLKLIKLAMAAAVAAGVALSVFVVVNQLALDRDAADRRAIVQRATELTRGAVAPGSALSCLDAGAGDTVEAACEARVFADAQSTAAAVAYVGARQALLTEAADTQPAALKVLTASRRAVELDRYGIAAHVLSTRDGCTPEKCAAFAWLGDATALKANMKAQAFDQYVSRHAGAWNGPAEPPPAAVSAAPQAGPQAGPQAAPQVVQPVGIAGAPPVAHPIPDKYTLPSAASIPAVSIMNSEPALSKSVADAQAAQFRSEGRAAAALPEARADDDVPLPRKRPPARAEPRAAPAPEPAAPTPITPAEQ